MALYWRPPCLHPVKLRHSFRWFESLCLTLTVTRGHGFSSIPPSTAPSRPVCGTSTGSSFSRILRQTHLKQHDFLGNDSSLTTTSVLNVKLTFLTSTTRSSKQHTTHTTALKLDFSPMTGDVTSALAMPPNCATRMLLTAKSPVGKGISPCGGSNASASFRIQTNSRRSTVRCFNLGQANGS